MKKSAFALSAFLGFLASSAVAQQSNVSINQLPVPTTGSTQLSTGDRVPATRGGTTYGLTVGMGGSCPSNQLVSSISAQGVPTCIQPSGGSISGLGTAAFANLGTSGGVVGLLSNGLTFSGSDTFSLPIIGSVTGTSATVTTASQPNITTLPAAISIGSSGVVTDFLGKVGIGTTTVASALAIGTASQFQVSNAGIVTSGTWNGTAIGTTYLPTATTSVPGIVKPDGTTITISSGIISASAVSAVPAPRGSFSKLVGAWGSNTTATWTAAQLVLQNSSNAAFLVSSLSASINTAATVGTCTGLDTGTLAVSTWYYVYDEENSAGSANCLGFSTSSTSPTLVSGYTYYARIGSFYSDASHNILGFKQGGRQVQYVVGENLSGLPSMASGSAGNVNTPTWASVAIGSYAPPTSSRIRGVMSVGSATAVTAMVAPNSSYGAFNSTTNPAPVVTTSYTGITAPAVVFDYELESTNIYWANSTSSGLLQAMGYEDNL